MEKNVGGTERIARLAVGTVLVLSSVALYVGVLALSIGPLGRTVVAVVAFLAGARLLWTGTTQKCRLNRRLGRNTYRGD